jgi:nucleoside-diphosphate-sugar epimerase
VLRRTCARVFQQSNLQSAIGLLQSIMYIVTGGAGFIGSHIVEALLQRGDRVRVVDNLATGHRRNLPAEATNLEFLELDLADQAQAHRAVAGATYVVHQAALPSVPKSVADPVRSNRANIDATLNLLVAARDAGARRVVYAGSSSAYGNQAALPKVETMTPAPRSPYALQKLVGEQYGQLFTELYGLETVTLRYFNVFGPRQDPSSQYSGVISRFATALLDGQRPTIFGDGEQTRDFTYVSNVVDGVLRACTAEGVSGLVMNVATGGRISLNELLRTMTRLVGATVEPIYEAPRAGDVRDSQADITLARERLGYRPLVHLEEGLRRTLDWYRADRTAHGAVARA